MTNDAFLDQKNIYEGESVGGKCLRFSGGLGQWWLLLELEMVPGCQPYPT